MKKSIEFNKLGDVHKKFESISSLRLLPNCPVIARLDGRSFHSLTRNAEKPFDLNFISSMEETCKNLVGEFIPSFGYVQSDEITLVWTSLDLFDGKVQKLCSTLSSFASVIFNRAAKYHNFNFNPKLVPSFDCRIWNVPDLDTCVENVLWREWDASKNSINMVAHTYFSNKELKDKSSKQRIQMLEDKNIHWNLMEDKLKRGSFFKRVEVFKTLTEEELLKIPENKRPQGPIKRSQIQRLNLKHSLGKIVNAKEVLFDNEIPIYFDEVKNNV